MEPLPAPMDELDDTEEIDMLSRGGLIPAEESTRLGQVPGQQHGDSQKPFSFEDRDSQLPDLNLPSLPPVTDAEIRMYNRDLISRQNRQSSEACSNLTILVQAAAKIGTDQQSQDKSAKDQNIGKKRRFSNLSNPVSVEGLEAQFNSLPTDNKQLQKKEKKAVREKTRRGMMERLYRNLRSYLCSLVQEPNVQLTSVLATNRASILTTAIEVLHQKFGVAIPAVSINELNPPTNPTKPVELESVREDPEKEKRLKKSLREKARRQKVNILSLRLGLMLKVNHYKDKMAVLEAAVGFFSKGKYPEEPEAYIHTPAT